MILLIIICEILFWIFLILGILIRYAFKSQKLSNLFLLSTPLIDLLLIFLTYNDLANNNEPTFMHGLSFVYIGYSIIYGKRTIKWADNLFNYYFNNAKNPNQFKVKEKNKLKYQWKEFKRICLCSLIILSFLLIGIYLSGFEHSFWFIYWIIVVISTVLIWFIIGPVKEKINSH